MIRIPAQKISPRFEPVRLLGITRLFSNPKSAIRNQYLLKLNNLEKTLKEQNGNTFLLSSLLLCLMLIRCHKMTSQLYINRYRIETRATLAEQEVNVLDLTPIVLTTKL